MIDFGDDVGQMSDRSGWVQRDAGSGSEMPNVRERAVQVWQDFSVHRDDGRAGLGECIQVTVGIGDHQVYVERQLRHPVKGGDDGHPDRDIGHEMTVHDIDVDEVGPACLDARDRLGEAREVGRQNRRRDAHRHLLTSRTMSSPGAVW